MATPIFFKLSSRLGLLHAPHGYSDKNIGVEQAPDAILTTEFLKSFSGAVVETLAYPAPEAVGPGAYLETIARLGLEAKTKLIATMSAHPDKLPIFLGGDHSVALNSLSAVLGSYNSAKTLVIMVDSHTDLHQPDTSPTGNFHGMWLRAVVDKFNYLSIDNLIPEKLSTSNLVFIGNLDCEQAEIDFIHANNIKTISHKEINHNPEAIASLVMAGRNDIEHIHFSIDVDGIDKEYAPGTGMPCKEGIIPRAINSFLKALPTGKTRSMDLVEVNPNKDMDKITVSLAQQLISSFISLHA